MGADEAAVLFGTGLVSAFFGTTVGGAGLVVISVLILLGLPPHMAIATSGVGALGLMVSGLYRFRRDGMVDWGVGAKSALFAAVGGVVGAFSLLQIPSQVLKPLVGLFLLGMLVFMWAVPSLGVTPRPPGRIRRRLGYMVYLPLGFWGGFFGAGYGVLSNLAMLLLQGKTFLQSAATRKVPGIVITTIALVVFHRADVLVWPQAIVLLFGMTLGSYAGAAYGLRRGECWVRRLFAIVVLASAVTLFW